MWLQHYNSLVVKKAHALDRKEEAQSNSDDKVLREQALVHLGFLHNLVNFSIALAGLIIGGFGGLSASQLPSPMHVIAPVILLEFGALIFAVLATIFGYEEMIINTLNKQIPPSRRVLLYTELRAVWLHPQFLFIAIFAIFAFSFAWLYLYVYKGLHLAIENPILLVLAILCVIFASFAISLKRRVFKEEKSLKLGNQESEGDEK